MLENISDMDRGTYENTFCYVAAIGQRSEEILPAIIADLM